MKIDARLRDWRDPSYFRSYLRDIERRPALPMRSAPPRSEGTPASNALARRGELLIHHDKHHATYVKTANQLVKGHAYYLDYQNRRQSFVDAFLGYLVNWKHVEAGLHAAEAARRQTGEARTAARA